MVYAASLSGGFVYEDQREDAGSHLTLTSVSWAIGPRALTSQSYAWTSQWWDAGPRAARTVSLGWHLLNGLLLWIVARRVLAASAAVCAAGLFLLLPIQTEAVASIAYRSELVAATGLLLALICAARGWIAAAWLCAAGSVLGKEVGIAALLLVPLWAWWFGPTWSHGQRWAWGIASLLPFAALVAWFPAHQVSLVRDWAEAAVAIGAFGRLLAHTAWSVAQAGVLSIDHDWAGIRPEMGAATLAAWALLWWVAPAIWRLALGWLLLALSLRIVLPLPEFHEHHLYTPLIAVSVAVGAMVFPKGREA